MKNYFFLCIGLAGGLLSFAQMVIQPGAAVYLNGSAAVYLSSGLPLHNAGTLSLAQGTLALSGNFVNTGNIVAGTSTLLLGGATPQTIQAGNASLYYLTLNKPTPGTDEVLLTGNLTVNGVLTCTDGYLRTGIGDTLFLAPGATLSGESGSSNVRGNIQMTAPLNGGTATFSGTGVAIDAGSTLLGNVTVRRTAGLATPHVSHAQNGTAVSIDQIWEVRPQFPPNGTERITLSWLAANDNGNSDFTQAYLWQSTNGGLSYTPVGVARDASSRSIEGPLPVFARITVGATGTIFPVEFLELSARYMLPGMTASGMPSIGVFWGTATESNVSHFEVERAIPDDPDRQQWEVIGNVPASGNSREMQTYAFYDPHIWEGGGRYLYRARSVDADGSSQYSNTAEVAVPESALVSLYPNPANDVLYVTRNGTSREEAQFLMVDGFGRKVIQGNISGTFSALDIRHLAYGVYYFALMDGTTVSTGKIIKR